jgi:hypothetical protein
MTLGIRKLVVLVLVAAIFVLANLWLVVGWLAEHGVVDWAQHVRNEYLTGTAITIVIALLILLAVPRSDSRRLLRRCSVCDHVLLGRGTYCSDCGSKV